MTDRFSDLCQVLLAMLVTAVSFSASPAQPVMFDSLQWTAEPEARFEREGLEHARPDWLLDGLSGKTLTFDVSADDGAHWITLWLESGIEDSSTTVISINDEHRVPDWHVFNPPAEPRTEIQSIYRVYHGPVEVSGGRFRVELIGNGDLVRLLAASVHPDPEPEDLDLLERLSNVGSYGSHLELPAIMWEEDPELADLSKSLRARTDADPNDAFASYWLEQVEILRRAEQNLRLMGWEWATDSTGQGIFDRFHQALMQFDALLDRPDVGSYPLYERVLFQRGRLSHWLYEERGGEFTRAQAKIDLAKLYARYPDDDLLAMYNGEPVETPDACDDLQTADGAPAWSIAQLEALCRLRTEIHWWVNDRQSDTGEFGGKIGDDVELFRWWPPVVLSGDTTALLGWRRLADGVMVTRKVYRGYSRAPIDVEHASEFIADTAPEMVFYSDDPEYVDRLRYSADYFKDLWTGYTPSGRRFFKSAWFSSTEVDQRPPRNRDLEYNTRATKAVRYLAWKTGDPDVVGALHEWSTAWRDAARRTDKGKPAGVIPASIRFPDEAVNGDEPNWYRANMFWEYFDWDASAGTKMIDQLLFSYTLTGDTTLLEPMHAALGLIRRFEDQGWPSGATPAPGGAEWAARHLIGEDNLWNSVAQWRFRTGRTEYDEMLVRFGTPYVRYRLSGDEDHLVEGLERLLETIRYNTALRTTEVLHTDRVRTPGAMHLKAMLTGDGTSEGSSPYYAASWEDTDEGFTALVSESGFERFSASIYHHAADSGADSVTLRVWSLDAGRYQLTGSGTGGVRTVEITARGQRIPIEITRGALTTITLQRQ